MSCGKGHRSDSDPTLLWLWNRPVAIAPIGLLAWEPPCAESAALKRQKRKKKNPKDDSPFFFFFFFGFTHGMWKFPGQGSNLRYISILNLFAPTKTFLFLKWHIVKRSWIRPVTEPITLDSLKPWYFLSALLYVCTVHLSFLLHLFSINCSDDAISLICCATRKPQDLSFEMFKKKKKAMYFFMNT